MSDFGLPALPDTPLTLRGACASAWLLSSHLVLQLCCQMLGLQGQDKCKSSSGVYRTPVRSPKETLTRQGLSSLLQNKMKVLGRDLIIQSAMARLAIDFINSKSL